jgi:hypothetical protein
MKNRTNNPLFEAPPKFIFMKTDTSSKSVTISSKSSNSDTASKKVERNDKEENEEENHEIDDDDCTSSLPSAAVGQKRTYLSRSCKPIIDVMSSPETKVSNSSSSGTITSSITSAERFEVEEGERKLRKALKKCNDVPECQEIAREGTLQAIAFEKTLFDLRVRKFARVKSQMWTEGYMKEVYLNNKGKKLINEKKGK